MAKKVKIQILEGALKGKEQGIRLGEGLVLENGAITVTRHDALVFGRAENCSVCLPKDDGQVSRHHFIMEINPPEVNIRDFGSLNGTYVNGQKIGSRNKGQSPEEGQKLHHRTVKLKDGDKIKVGETVLSIAMEVDPVCEQCGSEIATAEAKNGPPLLCPACRPKEAERAQAGKPAPSPAPVRCKKCGKDVAEEVGKGCRGDYVCNQCRAQAEEDPAQLLYAMLREAGLIEAGAKPKIPGYEVGDRIGKGGYGAVYRGVDKSNNRIVAIKVMLAKVAVSPKVRADFLREIETTKKLSHPNIISLIDKGGAGAVFYFVMEYCPFGSVAWFMQRRGGRLALPDAGPIMLQALDGLAYCHRQGIIHRDLKPDNILLLEKGGRLVAKISDLGLAKNFESSGLSGMTVTGQYAGTYQFMPREQLTHFRHVKPASDVWSMGATFYNMLTGRLPHDFPPNKDPGEVVLRSEVIPILRRDPSISKPVAAVIDRALAARAEDRYQDGEAMRQALVKVIPEYA